MRTESIADYIELNKNLTRDYQHEDNREFFTDTGRKNANGDTIFLVPIPALVWNEDALQPREIDALGRNAQYYQRRNHIRKLYKPLLNPKKELEPIIITRSIRSESSEKNTVTCWMVVDGHNRLMAYRSSEGRTQIPAVIFDGSPLDAVLLAIKSNNRDKLPMTSQEKLSTAWSVFVVMRGVKGQTKAILDLGVSKGTLQRFREQFKLITNDIVSGKLEDKKIEEFEWKEARDYPENQDTSEWDKDADDKYVIEVSEKLFKTFGHTLKKANTELISRGLERYLGEQVFLAILEWHREEWVRDDDSLRGWETAIDRYAPPQTPLCEHTDF